ncbi:hypothetical protein BH09MYX1_BH09MYX1_65580 [soil metagenome]
MGIWNDNVLGRRLHSGVRGTSVVAAARAEVKQRSGPDEAQPRKQTSGLRHYKSSPISLHTLVYAGSVLMRSIKVDLVSSDSTRNA